jgi:hypothetical protein
MNVNTRNNAVVAIHKSHAEAEAAVKALQHAAFDMKQLRNSNPEALEEHQPALIGPEPCVVGA